MPVVDFPNPVPLLRVALRPHASDLRYLLGSASDSGAGCVGDLILAGQVRHVANHGNKWT